MTEDEAKTKGCCGPIGAGYQATERHSKIDHENSSIGNTVYDVSVFPTGRRVCIGSACMAWRWLDLRAGDVGQRGFCGLAGKP